jgi:hypothetical protein
MGDERSGQGADRRRLEQRERTRDKRIEAMRDGAADLERWLLDLVRLGLAAAAQQPEEFWENTAARMVDAKLGSVGRRIRQWKALLRAPDWHELLLGEIAELYLLARSLRRLDQLPPDLRQEALSTAGQPMKREAVLAQPAVADRWLIAGRAEGADEQLRYRRSWLLGARTRRTALLLDFAWGDAPFDPPLQPGTALQADLCFYPGAFPLRAALRDDHYPSDDPFDLAPGFADFSAFLDAFAGALGANPWLYAFPALLDDVRPALHEDRLFLVDRSNQAIAAATPARWPLLALSAGHSVSVFGEWDGKSFQVLSAVAEGRLVCF